MIIILGSLVNMAHCSDYRLLSQSLENLGDEALNLGRVWGGEQYKPEAVTTFEFQCPSGWGYLK